MLREHAVGEVAADRRMGVCWPAVGLGPQPTKPFTADDGTRLIAELVSPVVAKAKDMIDVAIGTTGLACPRRVCTIANLQAQI